MERKTEWQWEGVRERRDEENEGRTVREKNLEERKIEKIEKWHLQVRLLCFSWVFVIIIVFYLFFLQHELLLLFLLCLAILSFVDFDLITRSLLLIHHLFCLAWLRFNWSLFCFHYVAYVASISFIPPQVLFTRLSPWVETWNVAFVGSFCFHLWCSVFFYCFHYFRFSSQSIPFSIFKICSPFWNWKPGHVWRGTFIFRREWAPRHAKLLRCQVKVMFYASMMLGHPVAAFDVNTYRDLIHHCLLSS